MPFHFMQVNPKAYANAVLNYVEGRPRIAHPRSWPVNIDIVLTKACNLSCVFNYDKNAAVLYHFAFKEVTYF
jgi:hypothetical protein